MLFENTKIDFKKIYIFLLIMYFFLTPLSTVLIENAGSILRIVGVAVFIVASLVAKQARITKMNVYYLFFVILAGISLLYSPDFSNTLQFVITQGQFLLLIWITSCIDYNEKEIQAIKKALVNSSRFMVVILVLFSDQREGRYRLASTFTEDPNMLNGYLLFGIANATNFVFDKITDCKKKILYFLEIILYLYVSFLTGSRGGMMALLGVIFLDIILTQFYENKDIVSTVNSLLKSMIFIVLMFCLSIFLAELTDNTILLYRFSIDNILASSGSGRYEIWQVALNRYFTSDIFAMLFGYGAGSFIQVMGVTTSFLVAHNTFINILIELGAVGLLFYLLSLINAMRTLVKNKEKLLMVSFVGFMILNMSLSMISQKPYWNILIMSNILICLKKNKDVKQNAK